MRTLLWLAVLASCSKTDPLYCDNAGKGTPECGAIDAKPTGDVIASTDAIPMSCLTAAVARWTVCVPTPTAPVPLPGSINTTSASSCLPAQPADWVASGQPDACFITATNITMSSDTHVIGDCPLVLFATGTIDISFVLDVNSVGKLGPGAATDPLCHGGMAGGTVGNFGGGGGGGSFGTAGAAGGTGSAGTATAGVATLPVAPMQLRGGCPGTRGGGPNAGPPGDGGGAVFLTAGTSISISANGSIDASGSGAGANLNTDPTSHASGGSGGGAGGMIVLVTPSILGTGSMFANGGGGACGGDASGMQGQAGGNSTGATSTAIGCSMGGGGHGGNGYAGSPATAGLDGASLKGGGGGGGGGGFVSSTTDFMGVTASPLRSDLP